MGYLMILRIIFTGMMLCLATAKDSHVCNCNCGDTYYTTPNADQQDSSCQLKKAGQLKFAGGKLFVCTGKEWKALQYEVPYGSKSNPGYSCKDIMDKDPPTNSTGVYWITLRGKIRFMIYAILRRFSEDFRKLSENFPKISKDC